MHHQIIVELKIKTMDELQIIQNLIYEVRGVKVMRFSKIPNWNFRSWKGKIYKVSSPRFHRTRTCNELVLFNQRIMNNI